jgi:hypothetical protein
MAASGRRRPGQQELTAGRSGPDPVRRSLKPNGARDQAVHRTWRTAPRLGRGHFARPGHCSCNRRCLKEARGFVGHISSKMTTSVVARSVCSAGRPSRTPPSLTLQAARSSDRRLSVTGLSRVTRPSRGGFELAFAGGRATWPLPGEPSCPARCGGITAVLRGVVPRRSRDDRRCPRPGRTGRRHGGSRRWSPATPPGSWLRSSPPWQAGRGSPALPRRRARSARYSAGPMTTRQAAVPGPRRRLRCARSAPRTSPDQMHPQDPTRARTRTGRMARSVPVADRPRFWPPRLWPRPASSSPARGLSLTRKRPQVQILYRPREAPGDGPSSPDSGEICYPVGGKADKLGDVTGLSG